MELEDFIHKSLVDIYRGIAKANQSSGLKFWLGAVPGSDKDHISARIEFDVAVEVSEKAKNDKTGGLQIKVVKADLGKSKENTLATTSRIKFIVEKSKPFISNEAI